VIQRSTIVILTQLSLIRLSETCRLVIGQIPRATVLGPFLALAATSVLRISQQFHRFSQHDLEIEHQSNGQQQDQHDSVQFTGILT
jgi:hypothetical protein